MIGVFWLLMLYHAYPFSKKVSEPIIYLSSLMLGYCFGGDKLAKLLLVRFCGAKFRELRVDNTTHHSPLNTKETVKQTGYLSTKFTFFIFFLLVAWLYWAFNGI